MNSLLAAVKKNYALPRARTLCPNMFPLAPFFFFFKDNNFGQYLQV